MMAFWARCNFQVFLTNLTQQVCGSCHHSNSVVMSWLHPWGRLPGFTFSIQSRSARRPFNQDLSLHASSWWIRWWRKAGPVRNSRWAYSKRSIASRARTSAVCANISTRSAGTWCLVNLRTRLRKPTKAPCKYCSCLGPGVAQAPRPKNIRVAMRDWKNCSRNLHKAYSCSSG